MQLLANIPDELWVIIGLPIIGGFLIAMTAIITDYRRKSQRDDMEATLKMEMIQRGMSAEDIERVLAARFGNSRRGKGNRYCPVDGEPNSARSYPR
jgi:hypothetical protein